MNTTTTTTGFAGRLRSKTTQGSLAGKGNLQRVGLRHFPRRNLGVYRTRLPR
jgi:hypothetical protein